MQHLTAARPGSRTQFDERRRYRERMGLSTAGAAAAGAPSWLILVLLVWAGVAPTVTAVLAYRAAMRTATVNREAARDQHERELRKTHLEHERETSRSNRELILQAIELTSSENEFTRQQGRALLISLPLLPNLSPDDAVLVHQFTRQVIEPTLSEGRRVVEDEDDAVRFVIASTTNEERGGDDEDDPSDT